MLLGITKNVLRYISSQIFSKNINNKNRKENIKKIMLQFVHTYYLSSPVGGEHVMLSYTQQFFYSLFFKHIDVDLRSECFSHGQL